MTPKCLLCEKAATDALTIRGWHPVHSQCAQKFGIAAWVKGAA